MAVIPITSAPSARRRADAERTVDAVDEVLLRAYDVLHALADGGDPESGLMALGAIVEEELLPMLREQSRRKAQ